MDFEQARKNMLNCQLRPNKVTAAGLLSAFANIPREKFVTQNMQHQSYLDDALPLNNERNLLPPCSSARLIQALEIQSQDLVLVVACNNGYEVALIAQIADMVIGLEDDDTMIASGTIYLAELNIPNAEITAGNLRLGVPAEAPFDAILICGGVEKLSPQLTNQLANDGKLAYIINTPDRPIGEARLITRKGNALAERGLFDAHAKPLKSFSRNKEFSF